MLNFEFDFTVWSKRRELLKYLYNVINFGEAQEVPNLDVEELFRKSEQYCFKKMVENSIINYY